jgi:DNA-binding SARP family transcriptional activator
MTEIQVGLLGEVTVQAAGHGVIAIRGRQQRLLLALLALNLGRPLSVERISDTLWDEDPPPSARTTIRGYVRRLRSSLQAGTGSRFDVIGSGPGGYRLMSESADIDLREFRTWRARATASTDPAEAASCLDRALALWRGRPLGDLDGGTWVESTVAALEEEILLTAERRCDLLLADRNFGAAAMAVQRLLVRHPLRESLWCRLLESLHRGGRTAEAVLNYQRLRRHLDDALGVEPSAPIRDLYRIILRGDVPQTTVEPRW